MVSRTLPVLWSRDGWRHVTLMGQGHNPLIFKTISRQPCDTEEQWNTDGRTTHFLFASSDTVPDDSNFN